MRRTRSCCLLGNSGTGRLCTRCHFEGSLSESDFSAISHCAGTRRSVRTVLLTRRESQLSVMEYPSRIAIRRSNRLSLRKTAKRLRHFLLIGLHSAFSLNTWH